ncbi:MAG: hypothetical protein ABSC55_18050 [Syntrophorhabdales bacterium]|jgi:hypothetical protein
MAKGWERMSTDEKLQALRTDVNTALDSTEENTREHRFIHEKIDSLAKIVEKLGDKVFEIDKRVKK